MQEKSWVGSGGRDRSGMRKGSIHVKRVWVNGLVQLGERGVCRVERAHASSVTIH